MKTFRIICGVLLVGLGLGAFYLTVRTLGTQSSWSAAYKKAEAAALAADDGVPDLEARERGLRGRLRDANAGYGRVFFAANPAFDAQGRVQVPLGTRDGLAAGENGQPGPILHAFAPTGGGNSETIYVGPFTTGEVAEQQAVLLPAFEVKPGEPQTWPVGNGDWRLRLDVPPSRDGRFTDLDAQLVRRRELLRNRTNTLELRRQGVAEAEAALAVREAELLGDADAPEVSDAPELKLGLIAAVTEEERARAADLAELDRLRRAVKNAADRLRTLLAENREAAEALPTAPAARAVSAAGAD